MKYLLVVPLSVSMLGCAQEIQRAEPSQAQAIDAATTVLAAHQVKSDMNQHFCQGEGFKYYTETTHAYSFVCKSGSYYNLVK